MFRNRTAVAVALALTAVVASTMSAGGAPAAPAETAQPSGQEEAYVVAFADGVEAGVGAVEAAGGTVVDVNEELGIALVNSANGNFIGDVQSQGGVAGAARNHSVGTTEPGMPHKWAEERPAGVAVASASTQVSEGAEGRSRNRPEPLADRQWGMEMIDATHDGAHRFERGRGVDVGIIDTGVDGTHPDIAPNFDAARSRNFTMDIPSVDGPCEEATCIDPNNVDDSGHGTHVAGIVAADNNGFGVGGVAPDATIVNLRAGQDSGYFFVFETVSALTEAGNLGLDVVNMSFFTDPWMFLCPSEEDILEGTVTPEELAEQQFIRSTVLAAVDYAHQRNVTLVAAAGNAHLNLAAPTRFDDSSPNFPPDEEGNGINARPLTMTNNCLDLPSEAPNVIQVSSVGPSTTKSDFSNYGSPNIEVSAPGGWFRDFVGTPNFQQQTNLILSAYPLDVAIEEERADENGIPTDDRSVRYCDSRGRCGFYTYLQGTSMAAPHAAGVAALIIGEHGHGGRRNKSLDPGTVAEILAASATDHACPAGGVEIYTDEGRPEEFNAVCVGDAAYNGLYGEGIINALNAVRAR